jgi:hypothetical protein
MMQGLATHRHPCRNRAGSAQHGTALRRPTPRTRPESSGRVRFNERCRFNSSPRWTRAARATPRSSRAATQLYEPARITTRQPSCSDATACHARDCGGRRGGDPSRHARVRGSNPLSSTTRNSQVNRPVASSLSTPPPPLIRARGTPGDGGHRLAHRHRPDARVARSGRGRRPGRRPGTGRTPRGVGPPPDPAAHDLGVHRALRGTDLALGIDRDQPLTLGRLQDAFQDHPEGGPASRYSAQVAAMCLFVVAVGHTLVSPKADTNPVVGGIPQVLVPPVPGGTFVPERRRRRRRHHSSPHPTSSVFPRRR